MPSNSFKHFRGNMVDVYRLIQTHEKLSKSVKGKSALSHITRSGVVMLCACWEHYVEAVLMESARYFNEKLTCPSSLPKQTQKHIAKSVANAKHELKSLELAGEGWKTVYYSYCCEDAHRLNTPKVGPLNELYSHYIGVDDITKLWNVTKDDINNFVSLRGDIAHKGRSTDYVYISNLKSYTSMIYQNSLFMDNALCDYLRSFVGSRKQPWRKATK